MDTASESNVYETASDGGMGRRVGHQMGNLIAHEGARVLVNVINRNRGPGMQAILTSCSDRLFFSRRTRTIRRLAALPLHLSLLVTTITHS